MINTIDNEKSCAKILGVNNDGTLLCAASSRISTSNGTALSLYEKSVGNPNNDNLIGKVLSSGHRSVMEHCYFNIAFNNVSVFVEQFIIEFRLASFTVQSRRYVDFSKVGFYKPIGISEEILPIFNDNMQGLINTYSDLLELGIPKEDARFILPYCFFSNFYCSCNARELLHMICTMLYGRGSGFEEIRVLGQELAEDFENYFPGQIASMKAKYISESQRTEDWKASLCNRAVNSPMSIDEKTTLIAKTDISFEAICESSDCNFASVSYPDSVGDILKFYRSREMELVNLCYKIKGISLSAITHLARHRMQSVLIPCVGNAIYTNQYVLPESIKNNGKALEIYTSCYDANTRAFQKCISLGLPSEYCIYFSLSGNTMDVIASMNGRELIHFIQLRTCNRAQWEIRNIAVDMLKLARSAYPQIFANVGPACFMTGVCPEGKKTCGEAAKVKVLFKNI